MQKKYISLIILMLLVIVFTIQNIDPIEVKFWFWSMEGSMALIIAVILLIGAATSAILSIPTLLKQKGKIGELENKVEKLQKQLINNKDTNSIIDNNSQSSR